MRKVIISALFIILLISFVSADVIMTEEPKDMYNLGDTINIPFKITTLNNINKIFTIDLICNGIETEVYKEYVSLSAGQELKRSPSIPLVEEFIGRPTGSCVIKAKLGDEVTQLTKEFTISDLININLKNQQTKVTPGDNLIIEGEAKKEDQELVQGIVDIHMLGDNSSVINRTETVRNGYFYLNFSIPKEMKSGVYLVQVNAHENDLNGVITNRGFINYNLEVTQVPTNLEIIFDTPEAEPGKNFKIKTILHDQTGAPIDASSIIIVRDSNNKIIDQSEEMKTGGFFELPIKYDQAPANWKVSAKFNGLTAESDFNISKKENISIELINNTVIINNTGNVAYCNKSLLIKINNKSLNVPICIDVDKSQSYELTAPEGDYVVKIINPNSNQEISKSVSLTGRAIDFKEIKNKRSYLLVWIFTILILGFVAFIFFKKGYKKSFFGHITKKHPKNKKSKIENPLVKAKNTAELSLSLKGDKQNISLVCIKIKNLEEIKTEKGSAKETLQKIVEIAEEKKAAVYQSQSNLFFLFAPVKTKTFSNEKTALNLAEKAKEILKKHNYLFKQQIEFGISLNYGAIIAKKEKNSLKFMSMGTLITTAKKIAGLAEGDILLGEKINERLKRDLKTEKKKSDSLEFYSIKEVRKRGDKNFLSNFVKRLEKEKKEKD